MRIKQIDIIGFKSFVDKVSLPFQEGINVVVGPNGCGKSNILDAIRWVMGEQSAKTLRGTSMEDVIFKGSAARDGLGMAEVSLVLATEDGTAPEPYRECAEIMVTRRLFRDGESEYYINKLRCRRGDIQELFLDTGVGAKSYSFIEQGNIEAILSAKPEERRSLIEDAAGVMKFKVRKKAALRKIESARVNLTRLEDVIAEVRRQSVALKRQAQKAERFRECRQELKAIEIRLAQRRYRELQLAAAELAATEKQCQASLHQTEDRVRVLEEGVKALRKRLEEREAETQSIRSALLQTLGAIDKGRERLEFNRRELERTAVERERLFQEGQELEKRLAETARERDSINDTLTLLDAELTAGEQELLAGAEKLVSLQEAEQRQSRAVTVLREKLFACLNDLSRFANQREEAERRLETLENRLRRNREDAATQQEKVRRLEEEKALAASSLVAARSRKEDAARRKAALEEQQRRMAELLSANREALSGQREEQAAQRSRLQALREMDGAVPDAATTTVPRPAGVNRQVADCLNVPKEQERVFESFLGAGLNAWVVEDAASSAEVLSWCRGLKTMSRLCFPFALAPSLPVWEGGVPLGELTMGAGSDSRVVRNLLEGAFWVERLDPFVEGRIPPGVTLVTADGEMLSWRGELVSGTAPVKGSGMLTRKRMRRELEESLRETELALSRLDHQRQVLDGERTELETSLRAVEKLVGGEHEGALLLERRLSEADNNIKRVRDRLEVLDLEQGQLREEREGLREAAGRNVRQSTVQAAEKERLQVEMAASQKDFDAFRREVDAVREAVTQGKVRQAGMEERRRAFFKRLEACRKGEEEGRSRLQKLHDRLRNCDLEREGFEQQRSDLEAETLRLAPLQEEGKQRLAVLEPAVAAVKKELQETEQELRFTTHAAVGERDAMSALRLRLQEKTLEKEHLRQALLEKFRFDPEAPQQEERDDWDEARQEAHRLELKRQLENIGEVNLTALDEYRAQEERLSFLVAQQQDLTGSVTDLEATIHRINATTCRRFREAFDQINACFQRVFPRLFAGGRAELRLNDENNLLETGVEIAAQPPGKRFQDLGLLSGGEKALTALALVFATFMVRPSPFCLLDEVDAPLDDANTDRYNGLIQELAKKSQFIIITHNKRTMKTGDALYGITMQEQGVSKVVSVRINEFR